MRRRITPPLERPISLTLTDFISAGESAVQFITDVFELG